MLQSHVIEIDGVFVGAAVRLHEGFRFVATDLRLEEIDGSSWPSLNDVRRVARSRLQASRYPVHNTLY
ncbi:hypothetical protein [Rhodovastum atsumiense]|nr:hypothetical protein [Rhodovastum atsumiense]